MKTALLIAILAIGSTILGLIFYPASTTHVTLPATEYEKAANGCKKNDGLKTITFGNNRITKLNCKDGAIFEWVYNEKYMAATYVKHETTEKR